MQELTELTGRRYSRHQQRQLEHMRIPFDARTNGSLVLLRIHVEVIDPESRAPPKAEPRVRFDGITTRQRKPRTE